ncbi:hypothetical protein HK097_004251 [Rhizophlyctis rosea]|uniref:Uncharacterized protein n=1 Tax=Rhizophlyctis rosea TaxID=64517 RepID=A0AAD5S3H3_9FUNG|nr:hypothetical protein HK097_004251 [Rhizophlyctis rosea]
MEAPKPVKWNWGRTKMEVVEGSDSGAEAEDEKEWHDETSEANVLGPDAAKGKEDGKGKLALSVAEDFVIPRRRPVQRTYRGKRLGGVGARDPQKVLDDLRDLIRSVLGSELDLPPSEMRLTDSADEYENPILDRELPFDPAIFTGESFRWGGESLEEEAELELQEAEEEERRRAQERKDRELLTRLGTEPSFRLGHKLSQLWKINYVEKRRKVHLGRPAGRVPQPESVGTPPSPPTPSRTQVLALEDLIIQLVATHTSLTFRTLYAYIRDQRPGISNEEMRAAVMRLLDRGMLWRKGRRFQKLFLGRAGKTYARSRGWLSDQ